MEFDQEREETLRRLEAARAGLLARIDGLSDEDLGRARRGQWTIAGVLDHVIRSEAAYVRVAAHLRGGAIMDPITVPEITRAAVAREELGRQRAHLLDVLAGVGEEEFYEMRPIGHEQYSIISLLENVELHDHEHTAQLEDILARSG